MFKRYADDCIFIVSNEDISYIFDVLIKFRAVPRVKAWSLQETQTTLEFQRRSLRIIGRDV